MYVKFLKNKHLKMFCSVLHQDLLDKFSKITTHVNHLILAANKHIRTSSNENIKTKCFFDVTKRFLFML